MENEQETISEVIEPETEPENPAQDNEALVREIESGKAAIAELKQALATRDGEVAALNQSLEDVKKRLEETGKSLATAVTTYRELVIQTNPGVLAEMVTGDSIEKVNDSLQSARAIMERARREVEAEAARVRVPAGAPQRAPQDLSALSAREKIQYGLGAS
jgi:predicted RNase H-like nuclease (RuvC/YqgF family)